ncbi:MAG: phosphotransferase [Thermoplasmata archaeon]
MSEKPPPKPRRAIVPGTGVRLDWPALPRGVRETIERHLDGPVRHVEIQHGGFSPAFAAILTSESGGEVFVKAGSPDPNPDVPQFYRQEWAIASALPEDAPAPRPLWFEDDGTWVLLGFEAIRGGNPTLPWKRSDLDRVVRALEEMTRVLTPSPIRAPSFGERHRTMFRGFRTLSNSVPAPTGPLPALDPWIVRHLDELAKLEEPWEELTRGTTLLNCDVRADNILLRGDRVYFVDWPWACIGPAWIELAAFLPSVAMQRGPKPWELFDSSQLAQNASPQAVRAFVAGLTGFFWEQSLRPAPPGLPTLREFQRAQGIEALEWLRRLCPEFD